MLKLKNITKYYQVNKEKRIILDNINLEFNSHELVFILGASGSGKSTLLNIISGNLKSDSGCIYINNQCINKYNSKKMANYQSNIIGNIFQDYNLIEYMSVYDNIRLASNINNKKRIDDLLKQLGIFDKKNMIVSKLSGGEKQRVAIIRAIVNNPYIVLADEPTGALDSKNGIEVMNILKELSRDKLVIVVSHDNNLANMYADRIINIKDGKCEYKKIDISCDNIDIHDKYNHRLGKIIKLAIKNLTLKKVRTIFTSLAISLGIISMCLIVNLYSNFNREINNLEKDIVSVFPITISNGEFENLDNKVIKSNDKIIVKDRSKWIHKNNITNNYLSFINNIKEIKDITYDYNISMPFISDNYKIINNNYLRVIPSNDYIYDNYDLLYGSIPSSIYDVLLVVDINNNVDSTLLNYFNVDKDIDYHEIINRKIKIISNDNYYVMDNQYYVKNSNYDDMYNKSDITLNIVGIIREKEETSNYNYLYYNKELVNKILDINKDSKVVKDIIDNNKDIVLEYDSKEDILSYLGYNSLPDGINIYVDNLVDKEKVIDKLDEYNKDNQELVYLDTMASTIDIVKKFISIISVILIMFSVIAITISSLMIGILTNTRVLERKKEIGILRSLGYLKKDIKRLFNIENKIIGIISIVISYIFLMMLVNPINSVMNKYLSIDNIFNINYKLTIMVFLLNIMIIKIAGIIPAIKASRMDVIKCIYNR